MSAGLSCEAVTVLLGGSPVVREVALDLEDRSYGVLVGPSGAGKSTLLRAIAGLIPASGTIRIGTTAVCADGQIVRPEERPLGFLFQGLALWPHMTVVAHLRYALRGRRVPAAEHATRIRETLGPLGLTGLEGRRPAELSGGESQRLALARALVTHPALLLLDEPTSSVDPSTAGEVRALLQAVHRTFGATILHVTHDQEEALGLGERIFVMESGRILRSGTPEDVYERPGSLAVARFIGRGGVLPATIRDDGTCETPLGRVRVSGADGIGTVWVLARPEDLELAEVGDGVPVEVVRATYAGGSWRAVVEAGDHELEMDLAARPKPGERLRAKVVGALRVVEGREP